jgi:hypothetical protein
LNAMLHVNGKVNPQRKILINTQIIEILNCSFLD